jgi:Fur family peroxide stress response transcriptional regulator
MDSTTTTARERLRGAGYRVTRQRLAVYAYLSSNDSHPTVDDIYSGIKGDLPRISVATVYKSVESLVDVGLLKPIYLGPSATRFDASTDAHAHFRCIECQQISDVTMKQAPVSIDELNSVDELNRCEVMGSTVEFYGFCGSCRKTKIQTTVTQESRMIGEIDE